MARRPTARSESTRVRPMKAAVSTREGQLDAHAGNRSDVCEIESSMHNKLPRIRKAWLAPRRSAARRIASDAVVSGTAASLASAAALMAASASHEGSFAGGLNGPSQWLWGEDEAYTRRL